MVFEEFIAHLSQRLSCVGTENHDTQRLFHGRGQCYPGFESVVVDLYYPVIWVTLFEAPKENFESELLAALQSAMNASGLLGLGVSYRYQDGAPAAWLWQHEECPEHFKASRGPLQFSVQLGSRQNTGFFLDMEPGREWIEQHCEGKKVLNLFAYTCAFSVVAAAAGAREVVNVDMARGALKQGQMNHQLNRSCGQLDACKTRFLAENIMKSWGRIRRPGPYDILVIDPPSFQKGSFVARSDYIKVLRRIPQLAVNGADILLCLNAPQLGEDFLELAMLEADVECKKIQRLESSADFPDVSSDQQLKLFHYQYNGETPDPRG